jgi:hypothetical protein
MKSQLPLTLSSLVSFLYEAIRTLVVLIDTTRVQLLRVPRFYCLHQCARGNLMMYRSFFALAVTFIVPVSAKSSKFKPNLDSTNPTKPWLIRNTEAERQKFTAEHETGTLHFALFHLEGDGDCGLHGLEITRDEFVQKLKKSIHDPKIRLMLKEDLKEAGFDSAELNNQDYIHFIDKHLDEERAFLTFNEQNALAGVERPNILTKDDQQEGTLAAAAAVVKLNVRVWRQGHGDERDKLKLVAKFVNADNEPFIDLLHVGIHYNRLINADDSEAMKKAARKEPSPFYPSI